MTFQEIEEAYALGNPLPVLNWAKANLRGETQELAIKLHQQWLREQRVFNLVGVIPYEERPEWQKKALKTAAVIGTSFHDELFVVFKAFREYPVAGVHF